jgi:hypothetical protein
MNRDPWWLGFWLSAAEVIGAEEQVASPFVVYGCFCGCSVAGAPPVGGRAWR